VIMLASKLKPEGMNTLVWDGRNASGQPVTSGVYFYQLQHEDGSCNIMKMMKLYL